MCRFWSGVTSCPNFKFPLRFNPISCCCVDILIFGGTWGIFQEASFLFQGGGVGLQLSQIESQESAVAHRVFLPLLVSSIKSLCQRHPPNFTERKNKKLANKGIVQILSRVFTIASFVGYGQEFFLNFRT